MGVDATQESWASEVIPRDCQNTVKSFLQHGRRHWAVADHMSLGLCTGGGKVDSNRREAHARATAMGRCPPYENTAHLEAVLSRCGAKLAGVAHESCGAAQVITILRAGRGKDHEPTLTQHVHRGMERSVAVRLGGAHICFLAGADGPHIWLKADGRMVKRVLGPCELLVGEADELHAGGTFVSNNDIIYFVLAHDIDKVTKLCARAKQTARGYLAKVVVHYQGFAGEVIRKAGTPTKKRRGKRNKTGWPAGFKAH